MRTMVTGDIHLSDNDRDRYRHEFMTKMPKLLTKHKIERLIILGDLCEEKDRHPARLVNELVSCMTALAKVCPVIVLMGNHDYLDRDNPFFRFLKRIRNITWIDTPKEIDGEWFLPHTDNWERDWGDLNLKNKVVFTHVTFDGADVGHGHKGRGVPLSAVKGCQVFSGDIHVPQDLGNVTYVGAPYTVDFGDEYEPRVLILTDDRVISQPVTGVQKQLIDSEWPLSDDTYHEGLHPGDILKVRIRLKPEQVAKWNEIREGVRAWGEKGGFHIYAVHPVAPSSSGAATRPTPTRKTDEQLATAFAKQRNLDERTLKTGLWLMKKTRTNNAPDV